MTALLLAWSDGDQTALDRLVPVVHAELRRLARRHMAGERRGHVLQTTALVNELYVQLVDLKRMKWQNRAHFFAMSARLMRRILVDFARAKGAARRGASPTMVSLDGLQISSTPGRDLVALDDALVALAAIDLRKSQVVEMRFFGGLGVKETAEAIGVSPETVMRDWKLARAWLLRELGGGAAHHT